MLPLTFKLENKRVLVLGAGKIGTGKAQLLIEAGARVDMISLDVLALLPDGLASFQQRAYEYGDLAGYMLVISAVADEKTNDVIVAEAAELGIWLNCVDIPERCDFYFMALHTAGDVTVAVTSRGSAPALAQVIRDEVAKAVPTNTGEVAKQIRSERDALHAQGQTTEGLDWKTRIYELLETK